MRTKRLSPYNWVISPLTQPEVTNQQKKIEFFLQSFQKNQTLSNTYQGEFQCPGKSADTILFNATSNFSLLYNIRIMSNNTQGNINF